MFFKLINKKTFLFCGLISILLGITVCIMDYDTILFDPQINNFTNIHDGNINEFDVQLFSKVLNVLVIFPFVLQILTDHKATNEIYIVSRMSNSSRFYYVRFIQIAILCLFESLIYNSSMLVTYLVLGKSETLQKLALIVAYSILINFLVSLVFASLIQLFSVVLNEKAALSMIILLFCFCFIGGFFVPNKISAIWITNFYFITPIFKESVLYSANGYLTIIASSVTAAIITAIGSFIYRRKDHI